MANLMFQRETPAALAGRGQRIEITNNIGDFDRLSEIVAADLCELPAATMPRQWRQVPVDITLRFGWIEARPGIPVLEGNVATTVAAVCQRCLEPLELALDLELRLLLSPTGVETAGYEGYEVWEFDENDVRPADIVEEALIMALPFSALHESSASCVRVAGADRSDDSRKVQPFADLQSLMANAEDKN